jgi:uncharacterized membrane protein (UPF0127 family)
MRFPIDVLFLDSSNRVVGCISRLVPYRLSRWCSSAHSVLELPCGAIQKSSTEVGDEMEISMAKTSEMDDLKETMLNNVS